MEELSHKYILLQDRVGSIEEGINFWRFWGPKLSPTQVLRGEILEALPGTQRPKDSSKIALVGIDSKSLRLECGMECLSRLTEEDANLLLAISSLEVRYRTYVDKTHLDFGRNIGIESKVFVTVKGASKKFPGIVRYKGELPPQKSTMFGVELIENPGQGTSDGTFRNKRYFLCAPASGVFVGLDKLTQRDDSDSKPSKKGESYQSNIASRTKEIVVPSFLSMKNQRVVTLLENKRPVRGFVRYIGEDKDQNGRMQTIVGLELATRDGVGTGKLHDRQVFVCREDFALFVPIEAVIPDDVFDMNPVNARSLRISERVENVEELISEDELLAKSLSDDVSSSGGLSSKWIRRTSSFENSASVIKEAGESSKTVHIEFIEKQQQLVDEIMSSEASVRNDENVVKIDDEKIDTAIEGDCDELFFRNTPPHSLFAIDKPSLPSVIFVHIDEEDHESSRAGGLSSRSIRTTSSSEDSASVIKEAGESSAEFKIYHEKPDSAPKGDFEEVSVYIDEGDRESSRSGSVSSERVSRASSVEDLASVIKAAGESSKTNLTEFIEQQQRLLDEIESSKASYDEEFFTHYDEKNDTTTKLNFGEKPPYSLLPTEKPSLSGLLPCSMYSDHVTIGKEDYESNRAETLPSHDGERQPAQHSLQEQLREKGERDFNLIRQPRQTEEPNGIIQRELENWEERLQERYLREAKLLEHRREKEQQENSRRQLTEMEQRLTICQEQLQEEEASLHEPLREKVQQHETSQRQLKEMEQRLTNCQEQLQEKELREACLHEQQRKKEEQHENSQRQLTEMELQLTNCQEQLQKKELREASLHEQLREKELQQEILQRQLTEMEQQLTNCEGQLQDRNLIEACLHEQQREKEEQHENSQRQLTEMELQLTNCQEQLQKKELREASLHEQLREKELQQEILQRQLTEMEQQLTNCEGQLQDRNLIEACLHEQQREKEEQHENSQRQLTEMELQLTNCQEQLQKKELREASLHEQLREKEQQQEILQRQLTEVEQQLTNCEGQLQDRNLIEACLHEQLREKEEQHENSQRQLTEMELQLTNCQEQLQKKELREASLHEQLREKEQQQEILQRQQTEMEQQLTNCQEQLQDRNLIEACLHEQLREKEQQQENSQRERTEMELQLTNCEGQIREKDEEISNIQQRLSTLERQLRVKEQEVNELELSLTVARQTLSQQRRQEACDWVISRHEIQMTDTFLGKGAWGNVYEGMYCGCSIAVKQIHELILSPHYRRLFEREMNIASRCRHPCLLQFIGATNDEGSPLFVTELMETSLRALLEQRGLSETEITVISLDVARALNYLHQKKPSPIVHRDVNSANVLLWRQGDQWRAKVSDYGTANFVQQTMTKAPGTAIYSAPETFSSSQTAMVDVYSFGVLLCEMCIRELPDPERREEQVLLVTNRVRRGLVRRCLQTDHAQRPNMEEIIEELKQFTETRL